MPFEALSRAAAVRYASVRSGLGPRTGAEKPADGTGGSGYAGRPPGFAPLTWHFRIPLMLIVALLAGLGFGGPQSRDPHVLLDPAQPLLLARGSCQRRRGQSAPFASSIVRGVVPGTGRRPLEDGLR